MSAIQFWSTWFRGLYETISWPDWNADCRKFGSAMSKLLWPPSAMFVLTHVSPDDRSHEPLSCVPPITTSGSCGLTAIS